MDNIAIHHRLTDTVLRGAITLPDGRTGLLFDGGTILAVTNPKVLADFEASGILASTQAALASQSATLAAIGNINGGSAAERLSAFHEIVEGDFREADLPRAPLSARRGLKVIDDLGGDEA